jgi:group I intron endonuclease
MKPRLCGAYAIIHCESGAAYVGSSKHILGRWWTHQSRLAHGKHHASPLQILWRRDGAQAFAFVVLEECHIEDLAIVEQRWLESFETVLNMSPFAWNPNLDPVIAARGAAKRIGLVPSARTREKLRASALAQWARGDHPRTRSDELKQRTSDSVKRAYAEGRHRNTHSAETRAKISAIVKAAYAADPERRQRTSEATKRAMAKLTPEERRERTSRASAALAARCAKREGV